MVNKKTKEQIIKEKQIQEAENMKKKDINFIQDDFFDDWEKTKAHNINLLKRDTENKLFFLSHSKDTIKGKPQLVQQTMKKIPLVRKAEKTIKDKGEEEKTIVKYKFLDDRFDKRYDGNQTDVMSVDFWIYRVVDEGKEYYIFSKKELENIVYVFRGMKIELDDFAEMSESLRVKALSNIFIMKNAEASIRSWSKKKIVHLSETLNKDYGYSKKDFIKDIFWHKEDNRIYSFTEYYNKLRASQLLSSKYEGYPLHLFKIGPAGTGKTCEQECVISLFDEEQGILEGADSRPKVLEPSFKEKPANIGYIAKCNRISAIDELFKMIENEISKSHDADASKNHLGSLNFLLEHKKRSVGSGNDNSTIVKSTSKLFITSNPLGKYENIYQHVGVIDPTTMSRMMIWVQDEEEQNIAFRKKWEIPQEKKVSLRDDFTIWENPPNTYTSLSPRIASPHTDASPSHPDRSNIMLLLSNSNSIPTRDSLRGNNIYNNNTITIHESNTLRVAYVSGEKLNNTIKNSEKAIINPFLTIYDSCQAFLSDFNEEKVRKIVEKITTLAREPMKSSIWRPRGLHHAILVLDGLVKLRCLFEDFDYTFQAKEEDYDELERILIKMIKSWDTNLRPKEDINDTRTA